MEEGEPQGGGGMEGGSVHQTAPHMHTKPPLTLTKPTYPGYPSPLLSPPTLATPPDLLHPPTLATPPPLLRLPALATPPLLPVPL